MLPVAGEAACGAAFRHEIKWDGFRVLAYHARGQVELESRGGFLLNDRFPSIVEAVALLDHPAVLDGELVAFDQHGRPNFSFLQQGMPPDGSLRYVVFDLLHLGEDSLCPLPWESRRAILESYCTSGDTIIVSPLLAGDAATNLEFARQHSLEGIVSKERNAPYEPGRRSSSWRKQKIKQTLDCIVVGVKMAADRVRSFGAALYDGAGRLIYVGNVGSGLREGDLEFLQQAVDLLKVGLSPAVNPPAEGHLQIWFRPHLVAEIEYLELTSRLRLRHPVFVRFRFDKNARQCQLGADRI